MRSYVQIKDGLLLFLWAFFKEMKAKLHVVVFQDGKNHNMCKVNNKDDVLAKIIIILHSLTLHRKLLLYSCLIETRNAHSLRRNEPEMKISQV